MSTHPTRSTDRERDERFFHFRNINLPLTRGRIARDVTAFVRRDRDGVYYISYAECDSRDGFNRKVGRNVARRKWFAGKRTAMGTTPPSYEEAMPEAYIIHPNN